MNGEQCSDHEPQRARTSTPSAAATIAIACLTVSCLVNEAATAQIPPYRTQFGHKGTGHNEFSNPRAAAVDSQSRLAVIDGDNMRVVLLDWRGTELFTYGNFGNGNGEFVDPRGVTFDTRDHMYVIDATLGCVQEFDPLGGFIARWGTSGSGDGQFLDAADIAFDSLTGLLFIADYGNSRVVVMDLDGNFVRSWGSPGGLNGEFSRITGLALDGQGRLLVADSGNDRVQRFSTDGLFIDKVGVSGIGPSQFERPEKVSASKSSGLIFVADVGNNSIQVFDDTLAFVGEFTGSGLSDGTFEYVDSVCAGNNDRVYVVDRYYHRLLLFGSDPFTLARNINTHEPTDLVNIRMFGGAEGDLMQFVLTDVDGVPVNTWILTDRLGQKGTWELDAGIAPPELSGLSVGVIAFALNSSRRIIASNLERITFH